MKRPCDDEKARHTLPLTCRYASRCEIQTPQECWRKWERFQKHDTKIRHPRKAARI